MGIEYRIVSDDISRGNTMNLLQTEIELAYHRQRGTEYDKGFLAGLKMGLKIVMDQPLSGIWMKPENRPKRGCKILLKMKRGDCPPEYCTASWSECWDSYENCELGMKPIPDQWIVGWRMIPE